jgi:hypothetical protein
LNSYRRTNWEETFEALQKIHGPLPIRYHDWFYSKLVQFLEALVYEGLSSGMRGEGKVHAHRGAHLQWIT